MNTFLGILVFVAIFAFIVKVITPSKSPKTLPFNDGTGSGGGGTVDDRPDGSGDDSTEIKL